MIQLAKKIRFSVLKPSMFLIPGMPGNASEAGLCNFTRKA